MEFVTEIINTVSWKTKLLSTALKVTKILEMGTKGKQIDHKKNSYNDFVIWGRMKLYLTKSCNCFLFRVNFMFWLCDWEVVKVFKQPNDR